MAPRAVRTVAGVVASMLLSVGIAACSSDDSASGTSPGSFCTLLGAFQASNADLDATLAGTDTAAVRTSMDRLGRQLETLRQQAPSTLTADLQGMVDFVGALTKLLAKYDFDSDKLQADEAGVTEFAALPLDQFAASRDLLSTYDATNCASGQP